MIILLVDVFTTLFCLFYLGVRVAIKNQSLFNKWISCGTEDKVGAISEEIKAILRLTDCSEEKNNDIKKVSTYFCLTIKSKWVECNRTRERFIRKNEQWLEKKVKIPSNILQETLDPVPGPSRGRPQKPFEVSTLKTKRRKVEDLLAKHSAEELRFAASLAEQKSGTHAEKQISLSAQQILALYLDIDL